jgi:hypothetical protein
LVVSLGLQDSFACVGFQIEPIRERCDLNAA